jgi:hypothetical protein
MQQHQQWRRPAHVQTILTASLPAGITEHQRHDHIVTVSRQGHDEAPRVVHRKGQSCFCCATGYEESVLAVTMVHGVLPRANTVGPLHPPAPHS